MPIKRIHPRKLLITPITRKKPIIRMQLPMPLTIVRLCKNLYRTLANDVGRVSLRCVSGYSLG